MKIKPHNCRIVLFLACSLVFLQDDANSRLPHAGLIAAGAAHSAALRSNGSLWSWDFNHLGQLGDGSRLARNTPAMVGSDDTWMAAGGVHSATIKSDGTLWAWGRNTYGQIGSGTTLSSASFVQILGCP